MLRENVSIAMLVNWSIVDSSIGTPKVMLLEDENKLIFDYPCSSSTSCTNYEVTFKPGIYKIEMYGACGGGIVSKELTRDTSSSSLAFKCIDHEHDSNVGCRTDKSVSGAGGYISGKITFLRNMKGYIAIGGKGVLTPSSVNGVGEGGYNGGGKGKSSYKSDRGATGGGSTDLRIDVNDIYHRILVAGGGGGTDDQAGNDGRGGAGGGLNAQGYQLTGGFETKIATQTSGYKFYNGQSGSGGNEYAGAGGGWYGGYASNSNKGGAGGGSSFALGEDPDLVFKEKKYVFQKKEYKFTEVIHERGVRGTNGQVNITLIKPIFFHTLPLIRRSSLVKSLFY